MARALAHERIGTGGRSARPLLQCQVGENSGREVLPSQLRHDPTKIVFSLLELGLTGIQRGILRRDYNIQVELSDYFNVIALVTLGDTPETIEQLCAVEGS